MGGKETEKAGVLAVERLLGSILSFSCHHLKAITSQKRSAIKIWIVNILNQDMPYLVTAKREVGHSKAFSNTKQTGKNYLYDKLGN